MEGSVVELEIRGRGRRRGHLLRLEGSQDFLPLSTIDRPTQKIYPEAELDFGS